MHVGARDVKFCVLGPLRAEVGNTVIDLGPPQRRAVLALLLIHANRIVTTETLCDLLWQSGRLPRSARQAIHVHVCDLRASFVEAAAGQVIETTSRGYTLPVHSGQTDLDAARLAAKAGRGLISIGAVVEGGSLLRQALVGWIGDAFADVVTPAVRNFATELGRERDMLVEERIAIDIELGHHRELVPELYALIRDSPENETLRAHLMVALYRSGRQSEALETYADARKHLHDELGLEPGPALQAAQQRILHHQEPAPVHQLRAAPVPTASHTITVVVGDLPA